jgi:hypothetical protein
MAREAHVTEQQIANVADTLLAAGLKPTSREIRARLGTGSMGTILKGLQKWKNGQSVGQPQRAVPAALLQTIDVCLAQERAMARAELAQGMADQQAELDVLILENERQAIEIASLNTLLESLKNIAAMHKQRIKHLENALDQATEAIVALRESAQSGQIEIARLTVRLEAMPAMQAELTELRDRVKTLQEKSA